MWALLIGLFRVCRYSDLSSCAIAPVWRGIRKKGRGGLSIPHEWCAKSGGGGVAVARMFEPDHPVGDLGVSVVVVVQGGDTPSI